MRSRTCREWVARRPYCDRRVLLFSVFALTLSAAIEAAPQTAPTDDHPLRIEAKELLIPVVVRDGQGKEVQDLTKADFQVFDNGKLHATTGFSTLHFPLQPALVRPVGETGHESGPPASGSGSSARTVVLLIDDRHLSPANLIEIQRGAVEMLDRSLGPSDRAVVLSFFGTNSGLTNDHAVLAAAIGKVKTRQVLDVPGDCPDIDYYAADQIVNKHSDTQFQIELEKAANCSHKSSKTDAGFTEMLVRETANRSLQLGDQDAIATVGYLRDVIHSIEHIPGQSSLVLISSGFLDYSDQAMRIESEILNLAASENIMISALDARGLGSAIIGAGQAGSGSILSQITGQTVRNAHEAEEEKDDVMAELADGTGGTLIKGSNDLTGGFSRAVAAPSTSYLLSISLEGVKANGTYHHLRIKVSRKDLTVRARQGYFAPKSEK